MVVVVAVAVVAVVAVSQNYLNINLVDGIWIVLSLQTEGAVLWIVMSGFPSMLIQKVSGIKLDSGLVTVNFHHTSTGRVTHPGNKYISFIAFTTGWHYL